MARTPIDPKYFEIAREHGISEGTLRGRVNARGWSPERAATTPLQRAGRVYAQKKHLDEEIDYARRKAVPIDVQRSSQAGVKVEHWSPERIAAHLAAIGPDKNFESARQKSSHLDITAPQERRNAGGRYQKKGGGW